MTWESILPKYYDYLEFEKNQDHYKVNDFKKRFLWLSQRLPFPFSLQDIRVLLVELKKTGLSTAYINYNITAINSFIRWCQLENLPQEDLTSTLNTFRPKEEKSPDANDLLSVDQVQAIITNPQRPPTNEGLQKYFQSVDTLYSLLFELIYKLAARSGEVLSLRKKDISFSNHSLTFYQTKNGENRVCAIPPDMEERLEEWVYELNETDYLFRQRGGKVNKPIAQEMTNKAFKYRCSLLGYRNTHVHQLRHSAITHLLINGAPIPTVQALCGHKRMATTSLYTHILIENQRDMLLKYNPLIRKTKDIKMIFHQIKEYLESMKLGEDNRLFYTINQTTNSLRFDIYVK